MTSGAKARVARASLAPSATVFHEGERAVQRRAGVERVAAQVGRGIASWIPPAFAEFVRRQPIFVLASQDAAGRVWASLIDGGVGQLNAALEAMQTIGVSPPFTISLAKQEEEVYRPGEAEPLRLSRHAAALRLLQYVRDEAHRFAQHYHHILRRKKLEE